MSNNYKHGVYIEELSTALQPMTQITTPPVVFGTAPVHLAKEPAGLKPALCYSMAEFVTNFGWSDDFGAYTLCEAARVHFQLYNVAPVVFVNVLDAEKHGKESEATVEGVSNPATISAAMILSTLKVTTGEKPVTSTMIGVTTTEPITIPATIDANNFTLTSGEVELVLTTDYTISDGKITFTEAGAEKCAGNLTFTSGEDTFAELVADVDYTAEYNANGEVVLTVVNTGKVVEDKITLNYTELDASKVTASDIIGGVDIVTGDNTGLELVEEIYPRFGLVPGHLIAPHWSTNSAVAAMLHAKAEFINGVFRATAGADIPTDEARNYTDVFSVKNSKNYSDPFLFATWPKGSLDTEQSYLSTHLSALMCKVDAEHGDIPYKSPSNESIQVDKTVRADGTEIFLGKGQANYLNGQGVVTALNFIGGWRAWGNRSSAYPANVDPKDSFIPCRRMMNWVENSLVINYWSQIDDPMNKRLVESFVDKANIWFNGLVARGVLLGGRVEFREDENPVTSLVDGVMRFHVYLGLTVPAREIDFVTEFDVNYLTALFA